MTASFCIDAVKRASGNKLTEDEVIAVFEEVDRARKGAKAEGLFDNADARLKEAVDKRAKDTVILAALQRKQAALNIIARDKLDGVITELVAGGLTYPRALLSVMEGSIQGIRLGRESVAKRIMSYESKYRGEMMAAIVKERPHLERLFNDEKLMSDTHLEMYKLGSTNNADARFLAETYKTFSELARKDSNRLGANIGKLDEWAPTIHDEGLIRAVGEKNWRDFIYDRINWTRTGKNLPATREAREKFLSDIYRTITTGIDDHANALERGERFGPAKLSNGLERHRVLHFTDGAAAEAYRAKFGYGNLHKAMFNHLERVSRINGQMEVLGPNPIRMIEAVAESLRKKVKADPHLTELQKTEQGNQLQILPNNLGESGFIGKALVEMSGLTLGAPASGSRIAHYTQVGRTWMAATKLTAAVWTAIGTDQVIGGVAGAMRGGHFMPSLGRHIAGLMRGRPKGAKQQIAYLYGVGFNSFIDNITTPFQAVDAARGMASKWMMRTFKYTGFSWETDVTRATAANMIDHELGTLSGLSHDKLPRRYAHGFSKHGITADIWEPMRKATMKTGRGDTVLLPDLVRDLPDSAFDGLVNKRLAGVAVNRQTPKLRERFVADAKHEVEMALRGYVIDEVNFANPVVDAATRRFAYQGHRPGTASGEILRSIVQFKTFGLVFTRNVLGRAAFGGQGATRGERFINGLPHIGALLAFLTLAGYGRIVAVDTLMGRWPPRDPLDWKTITAAAMQGGAMGIYGDFLFSESDRFGRSPSEMVIGPLFGELSDVFSLAQSARSGNFNEGMASRGLNLVVGNVPFINWWYTRAAVNYLFINALREYIKPGYLAKRDRRREKEYGQRNILPPGPFE